MPRLSAMDILGLVESPTPLLAMKRSFTVFFFGFAAVLAVAGVIVVPHLHRTNRAVGVAMLFGGALWMIAMGLWTRHKATLAIVRVQEQPTKSDGAPRAVVAPDIARKWRRIEIGDSIAGVAVSVVAALFLPIGFATLVIVFVALCVADTWYLGQRLRRTGSLRRMKNKPSG